MGNPSTRLKSRRRWTERTRILALMLLVVVPAAALIGVSYIHLRSIQRDHAVEAAIQRDYQQVLAIADKKIAKQAYEIAEKERSTFPACATDLDKFLANNPEVSSAFIYDSETGLEYKFQPARMSDKYFSTESLKIKETVDKWFDVEGAGLMSKLKSMQEKDGRRVLISMTSIQHEDKWEYQPLVFFLPPSLTPGQIKKGRVQLAGFAWDRGYIFHTFFPKVLNAVIPAENATTSKPQTALMVRMGKMGGPLATSSGWDGGSPELERMTEAAFPGLMLGIKLRGTTIAELSQQFLRTNFITLSALSLLLCAGIALTYRNITREVALAKLKSDFVSNVSHELRTPLALIRLYAETLELGRLPSPEKQHEYHQIIRKESERLTALINNILDFSRIESGRKEYEFRDTDLGDLVRTTLESYRYEIEQNGFEFEQKIEDDIPPVRVDREAIARSLINLVNNALKYSSKEKFLGVSLSRNNGSVKLEVSDHGIGIPPHEQAKIFEKFYRVGDPLVHNTKGSGLGLSLVRHIVDAHGGVITVDSAPGQGSKFIITLPVQSDETSVARRATA